MNMNTDERERPERIYIHSGCAEYHLSHTPPDKAEYAEYVRADIAAVRPSVRQGITVVREAEKNAANAVRDKCVEKVREIRCRHLKLAERLDRQGNLVASELQRVRAGECEDVATALESLTLELGE